MGKLDGKVAIVTGAGRWIGRAIAEAYVQEGAKVAVTAAREQAELNHLAKQDGSERVLALLADVTNPEICEQVVDQTIQRFGQVDILDTWSLFLTTVLSVGRRAVTNRKSKRKEHAV